MNARATLSSVIVKYFNRRMLWTVDLSVLFSTLFDAFGDDLAVQFLPMNEDERKMASDETNIVVGVKDRIFLFEMVSGEVRRRADLEAIALRIGQK